MTPADCDLRGMPFMPLDVIRLLDSDLFALTTGEEFKAAVALWCKSWTQVPAGSLPNDDRVLAHLSSTGSQWKKIKGGAMRGWALCSDHRWYHPVVSEKALEALPMRKQYVEKKIADAARKAREREDRKALFELLRSHGIVPEWEVPTRQLRDLAKSLPSQPVTPPVTKKYEPVTCDMSQLVTGKTETGKVKGQEYLLEPSVPDGTGVNPPPQNISSHAAIFQVAVPWFIKNGCAQASIRSLLGRAEKLLGADRAWDLAAQCMKENPIEATAWLAAGINARLGMKAGKKSRHNNFDGIDYCEGITEDGRIT